MKKPTSKKHNTPATSKEERIAFRAERDLLLALGRLAAEYGQSSSWMIRALIIQAVKVSEAGGAVFVGGIPRLSDIAKRSARR